MPGFVCLCYHRISEDGADPYTVSPRRFEAQMRQLARLGFRGVRVSEALRANGRVIALSFDDAYQDFADTAWPVLRGLGFGATLFVVSGRVSLTADWPGGRDAPIMGRDAIRALAGEGIEIGGHGITHRRLTGLPVEEASAELAQTYQDIQQITGVTPAAFAYPYGVTDAAVSLAVAAAGFETGWTARGGRNSAATPRTALRRTLLQGRDTAMRFAIKALTGYAHLVELKMDARRIP